MKITHSILSIPPYLSTTWDQISTLHVKDSQLVVSLYNGTTITVPGLNQQEIELIFNAHAAFLDAQTKGAHSSRERAPPFQVMQALSGNPPPQFPGASGMEITPLRLNLDNVESLAASLQHNPAQANLPDLPEEMVNKIAAIAKIIAPDEVKNMPKAEQNCNCPHCQILRAISGETKTPHLEEVKEDEVSESDLSFQEWDIVQSGDRLYTVTNKLDTMESYRVYLGEPVGCTCGKPGCEHILAVLKS